MQTFLLHVSVLRLAAIQCVLIVFVAPPRPRRLLRSILLSLERRLAPWYLEKKNRIFSSYNFFLSSLLQRVVPSMLRTFSFLIKLPDQCKVPLQFKWEWFYGYFLFLAIKVKRAFHPKRNFQSWRTFCIAPQVWNLGFSCCSLVGTHCCRHLRLVKLKQSCDCFNLRGSWERPPPLWQRIVSRTTQEREGKSFPKRAFLGWRCFALIQSVLWRSNH